MQRVFRCGNNFKFVLLTLVIILLISIIIGVSLGPVSISFSDVWHIIFYKFGLIERENWSSGIENIVWLIRLPRVLLAVIVGAGLAVVGVTLQALVRNPLADSYILGISSGASVGAVLAIGFGFLSSFGILAVQLGGFLGALISFIIVYFLTRKRGYLNPVRLILSGIGVGYFFSGITSFITITSDNKSLAGQVLSWTLGSLARASWFDLTFPSAVLLIITFYLVFQSRNLNLLVMGDETATALGLNVDKFRRKLFIFTALMTGILVAVSGTIGFIGLIVPHAVRFVVHTDHRKVVPLSVLVGGIFLVWVDVVARTTFVPAEIPVGVITSLLGGPLFLAMLLSIKNHNQGG